MERVRDRSGSEGATAGQPGGSGVLDRGFGVWVFSLNVHRPGLPGHESQSIYLLLLYLSPLSRSVTGCWLSVSFRNQDLGCQRRTPLGRRGGGDRGGGP